MPDKAYSAGGYHGAICGELQSASPQLSHGRGFSLRLPLRLPLFLWSVPKAASTKTRGKRRRDSTSTRYGHGEGRSGNAHPHQSDGRTVQSNFAQRDLYVLALSELQAMNETDELSYFGITGIDAYPLRWHFPNRLIAY